MFIRMPEIREKLDLSQRNIAKLLNVSKSTYARWETGEKIIPLNHLIGFANITKYNLDYITGLSDDLKILNFDIKIDRKKLSNRLRNIRLSVNLTQLEFAIILNTVQSVVSDFENGKTLIQTSFIFQICKMYNISLDKLLN